MNKACPVLKRDCPFADYIENCKKFYSNITGRCYYRKPEAAAFAAKAEDEARFTYETTNASSTSNTTVKT